MMATSSTEVAMSSTSQQTEQTATGQCAHTLPSDYTLCQLCGHIVCGTCEVAPPFPFTRLKVTCKFTLCIPCGDTLRAVEDLVDAWKDAPAPRCATHAAGDNSLGVDSCAACATEAAAARIVCAAAAIYMLKNLRLQGLGSRQVRAGRVAAATVAAVPLAGLGLVTGVLSGLAQGFVGGLAGGAVVGGAVGLDARNATASACSGAYSGLTHTLHSARHGAPSDALVVVPPPGSDGHRTHSTANATAASSVPVPVPVPVALGGSGPDAVLVGDAATTDTSTDTSAGAGGGRDAAPTAAPAASGQVPAAEELRRILACKNAYEILCVSKSAEISEIRTSYRARSRMYHPDRNPEAAAKDVCQALNNAYMLLGDPEKRKAYDASNFRNTSGINLFAGIKVTASGVAVSVFGCIVGGVFGAGVGAVSGAAFGAVRGVATTLRSVSASTVVQHSANETLLSAVDTYRQAVLAAESRSFAACGGVRALSVTPLPTGEIRLECTIPGASGWWHGVKALRARMQVSTPILSGLVTVPLPKLEFSTLFTEESQVSEEGLVAFLQSLRQCSVTSGTGTSTCTDATTRTSTAVGSRGSTSRRSPPLPLHWLPPFLLSLYSTARTLRVMSGVIDDTPPSADVTSLRGVVASVFGEEHPLLAALPPTPGTSASGGALSDAPAPLDYDDPRVEIARSLGVGLEDVESRAAPKSALGLLGWTSNMVSKNATRMQGAHEFEEWSHLVAAAGGFGEHPSLQLAASGDIGDLLRGTEFDAPHLVHLFLEPFTHTRSQAARGDKTVEEVAEPKRSGYSFFSSFGSGKKATALAPAATTSVPVPVPEPSTTTDASGASSLVARPLPPTTHAPAPVAGAAVGATTPVEGMVVSTPWPTGTPRSPPAVPISTPLESFSVTSTVDAFTIPNSQVQRVLATHPHAAGGTGTGAPLLRVVVVEARPILACLDASAAAPHATATFLAPPISPPVSTLT